MRNVEIHEEELKKLLIDKGMVKLENNEEITRFTHWLQDEKDRVLYAEVDFKRPSPLLP